MKHELELTDAELELVLGLLEEERRELPTEIHHTDRASVRESLHERLKTVNRLVELVRGTADVAV
jgi:hypothetical protein